MSWEYLKNREAILQEQRENEMKEHIEETKKEYFLKEGFYKDVVCPALDEAIEEKCFLSYKGEEIRDGYVKIRLIFPEINEYISADYFLEMDSSKRKIMLEHEWSGMYICEEEIDFIEEFYEDGIYKFSGLLDNLFILWDRQMSRD